VVQVGAGGAAAALLAAVRVAAVSAADLSAAEGTAVSALALPVQPAGGAAHLCTDHRSARCSPQHGDPGDLQGLTEAHVGVAGLALAAEAGAGRRAAAPRASLLAPATAHRAAGPPGPPGPPRVWRNTPRTQHEFHLDSQNISYKISCCIKVHITAYSHRGRVEGAASVSRSSLCPITQGHVCVS